VADDDGWPEYAKLVLAELRRHDEWLGSLDKQINNHVNHIEHRLTEIETTIKNLKWIVGIILVAVLGIFSMTLSQVFF